MIRILTIVLLFSFFLDANAYYPKGTKSIKNTSKSVAGCAPATRQIEININNVRATLLNGGDFWWDLSDGRYEVPKVAPGEIPVGAVFAASTWIGAYDVVGNLKVAAQTYRQTGIDFWPGPINANDTILPNECLSYDRFWQVNSEDIKQLLRDYEADEDEDGNPDHIINHTIPEAVLNWPGKDNPNEPLAQGHNLAPFFDRNMDGVYNPQDGDFPIIGNDELADNCSKQMADQMTFWVYNDVGNEHTESGGESIGLEIRALAFAYKEYSDNPVDVATYYKYQLVNKSAGALDSLHFALWVDTDLGCYQDDFVGCDTTLNLAYTYNGDSDDENCGSNGYGAKIPMFGVDFIQTPVNTWGETGMSYFLHYDSDQGIYGNPNSAVGFYSYMTGMWLDGMTPWTYGGDGRDPASSTNPKTRYFSPSDPNDTSPNAWSECNEGNTPSDRRFLSSVGPYDFTVGEMKDFYVSAVFARQNNGQTACNANIDLLRSASEQVQDYFNSCFKTLDGPDMPFMTAETSDGLIQMCIQNDIISNNYKHLYNELDETINSSDNKYNFQGYKVYQLRNDRVTLDYINDTSKAKLVGVYDLNDAVSGAITNYYYDEENNVYTPVVEAVCNNTGLPETVDVTIDLFTGEPIKNYFDYHFVAVPFAYNNYAQFDIGNPNNTQQKPYLQGKCSLKTLTIQAIKYADDGSPSFGDGVVITKLKGSGNGGNFVDLPNSEREKIANQISVNQLTYKKGEGPIDITIINPDSVKTGTFTIHIYDEDTTDNVLSDSAYWVIKHNGTAYKSSGLIKDNCIEDIPALGFLVEIAPVEEAVHLPTLDTDKKNGFIGSETEYIGGTPWLTGVTDEQNQLDILPWEQGGSRAGNDPLGTYSTQVENGTWFPYTLADCNTSTATISPAWIGSNCTFVSNRNKLEDLQSVDIVFTTNKALWSKCVVIETSIDNLTNGNTPYKRSTHPSWNGGIDGSGNPIYGNDPSDPTDMGGRSLFPGYAVNPETGERLNIFFGEDSYADGTNNPSLDNGNDLLFNPNDIVQTGANIEDMNFGGKHYIYVDSTRYDECHTIDSLFTIGSNSKLRAIYQGIMWTSMAYLKSGLSMQSLNDGLVPSDAIVKIRVNKKYTPYDATIQKQQSNIHPVYRFDLTTSDVPEIANIELEDILMYPNPVFSNNLLLNLRELPLEALQIDVYSVTGQLIHTVSKEKNVYEIQISLPNTMSTGTYFIEISNENGQRKTHKLIVI